MRDALFVRPAFCVTYANVAKKFKTAKSMNEERFENKEKPT